MGEFKYAPKGFGIKCKYTTTETSSGTEITLKGYLIYYSIFLSGLSDSIILSIDGHEEYFGNPQLITEQNAYHEYYIGEMTRTIRNSGSVILSGTWNASIRYGGTSYGPGDIQASKTIDVNGGTEPEPTPPPAVTGNAYLTSSNVDIGTSLVVNISGASSANIVIKTGGSIMHQELRFYGSMYSYTLSDSEWLPKCPNSTSVQGLVEVQLFNSSGQALGGQYSLIFFANVPDRIKPVITPDMITLSPKPINGITGIFVQNKNGLHVDVQNARPGQGASGITSYTFYGSETQKTTSIASADLPASANYGDQIYKVKVIDSRGRSAEAEQTIACKEYRTPEFVDFKAYKSNINGIADAKGQYIYCSCEFIYTLVKDTYGGDTNSATVTVYFQRAGGQLQQKIIIQNTTTENTASVLLGTSGTVIEQNVTYTIWAVLTDSYGGTDESQHSNVFGDFRILNVTSDGTGFAIGKKADTHNLFDCAHKAKFRGNVEIDGDLKVTGSGGGSGIPDNADYVIERGNRSTSSTIPLDFFADYNERTINISWNYAKWKNGYVDLYGTFTINTMMSTALKVFSTTGETVVGYMQRLGALPLPFAISTVYSSNYSASSDGFYAGSIAIPVTVLSCGTAPDSSHSDGLALQAYYVSDSESDVSNYTVKVHIFGKM